MTGAEPLAGGAGVLTPAQQRQAYNEDDETHRDNPSDRDQPETEDEDTPRDHPSGRDNPKRRSKRPTESGTDKPDDPRGEIPVNPAGA